MTRQKWRSLQYGKASAAMIRVYNWMEKALSTWYQRKSDKGQWYTVCVTKCLTSERFGNAALRRCARLEYNPEPARPSWPCSLSQIHLQGGGHPRAYRPLAAGGHVASGMSNASWTNASAGAYTSRAKACAFASPLLLGFVKKGKWDRDACLWCDEEEKTNSQLLSPRTKTAHMGFRLLRRFKTFYIEKII